MQSKLTLGNLSAARDWGFSGDYVRGMYLMMQHSDPEDWVLATGEAHTVKDFAEEAFSAVGLNWEDFVVTSEKYERPNEVKHLLGDSTKAQNKLGWKPETSFKELVKIIQKTIGFNGDIKFDTTKPDGNPRKLLDSSKIFEHGWKPKINLKDGLESTYDWYLNNYIIKK